MTEQERSDLWRTFHRFQKSRERAYAPKINKALKDQVNQFLSAKQAGYSDSEAIDSIKSFGMLEVLKPLYMDAGITYGAKTLTYLKREKARMPIGFNELMTQLINNYFTTELLNTVEGITDYTKKLIRDILIASYAAGNSFAEISDELQSIGFTRNRSRLIARTESVSAANVGAMLSAQTTGVQYNKIWISAQDDRTRRVPRDQFDHLHMNGVTVPYNDPFLVPGKFGPQRMMQPGDPKNGSAANVCNCRCTVGFKAVRDKNGRLVTI